MLATNSSGATVANRPGGGAAVVVAGVASIRPTLATVTETLRIRNGCINATRVT